MTFRCKWKEKERERKENQKFGLCARASPETNRRFGSMAVQAKVGQRFNVDHTEETSPEMLVSIANNEQSRYLESAIILNRSGKKEVLKVLQD